MRLTPAHVREAVEAGQYTDRRTTEYMIRTLIERQHKLARWAFSQVAPISKVEASGGLTLCFDDLWLRYDFDTAATTRYAITTFDYTGKQLAATSATAAGPRTCTQLRPGEARDGYTIAKIEIRRRGEVLPPVFVHAAKSPTGYRVVGIDRH